MSEANPEPSGVVAAVARYGGVLVAPRRTVAALAESVGVHDGVWLGLLYVAGSQVYPLVEAFANAVAVRNWGGVVLFASAVGRALIPPIVLLVLAETVLGTQRSHRRGLCLVPLVVVGTLAHVLRQNGVDLPGPDYLPDVVGGALGGLLAWWLRPEVPPVKKEES